MNDRELLELAAKAAGIEIHIWKRDGEEFVTRIDLDERPIWNPLLNDGDALRLAVHLRLSICHHHATHNPAATVMTHLEWSGRFLETDEAHGDDPLAATRRAILRAAAEIGKAM